MFRSVAVPLVLTIIGLGTLRVAAARVIDISPYSYAAIAYSPKTGEYAYAYNYRSRERAEQEALKRCQAEDARIVCWVNHGFCTLAVGEDKSCWGTGYTHGNGCSLRPAANTAVEECNKQTSGARIVLALSSDGQVVLEEDGK